jgi:hypothetical protein
MSYYILILSILFGFLIAKYFSGKKEGEEGRIKSLKFNINKYTIHIHHWFFSLLLISLLAIIGVYNDIIYGFLIGLIIQGLTYKDFYKLIY